MFARFRKFFLRSCFVLPAFMALVVGAAWSAEPDSTAVRFRVGMSAIEAALQPGLSASTRNAHLDTAIAALRAILVLRPELWTLVTKVETSCDRILIAGGANVEAEWEQGPAV